MAQDWAVDFYHSGPWKRNRAAYMRMQVDTPYGTCPPYMCERCFEHGVLHQAKVVHHKVHLTPENISDPHITLSFGNFMRLCQDCHAAVHSDTPPSRVTFDERGNVIWKEEDWH